MNSIDVMNKAADNIRCLALSMVERAKSGHPGGALGGADFINVLFSEYLRFDPDCPGRWARDRFFLDPGHMSPMLYAQLALTGRFSLEELEAFRQWLEQAERAGQRFINPPELMAWNMEKTYLCDLAERGARVIPSVFVPPLKDAVKAGTLFEPNYEALNAYNPQLIVIGSRMAKDKVSSELAKLAPTIDMTAQTDNMKESAKARIDAYAKIFGKRHSKSFESFGSPATVTKAHPTMIR